MTDISLKNIKMMNNVWQIKGVKGVKFVTENQNPGQTVYGEKLFNIKGKEYREWDHKKSKLASGMINHIRIPSISEGAKILYLGASTGTTVSHVSDMVKEGGTVYAVEFAARPSRDLYNLAKSRENIVPILADARFPQQYTHIVEGVDLLYCDVAQPTQSELFVKNAKTFLNKGGQGYIAIKTRSISQRGSPKNIFKDQVEILENGGFETIKTTNISRIHRDHYVYLGNWNQA